MNKPRVHCPLCNTTEVDGQGSIVRNGDALVQYHCNGCGELFFEADRRTESPLPTSPD